MLVTVRHIPQNLKRYYDEHGTDEEQLAQAQEMLANNEYVRVADIPMSDDLINPLDVAYKVTNSVEYPWYTDEDLDVTEEAKKGCRSTSVGDLIQINGRSFLVKTFGYSEI